MPPKWLEIQLADLNIRIHQFRALHHDKVDEYRHVGETLERASP
jgi:hypothetical protein